MDNERFAWLRRRLRTAQSRRDALGKGLATLGVLTSTMAADARKKRKKKRKNKKPPTCLESCNAPCTACFTRKEGSVLCGNILGVELAPCGEPCFTDNDCVGSGFPYCALRQEERATGELTEFAQCQPNVPGRCTSIPACAA